MSYPDPSSPPSLSNSPSATPASSVATTPTLSSASPPARDTSPAQPTNASPPPAPRPQHRLLPGIGLAPIQQQAAFPQPVAHAPIALPGLGFIFGPGVYAPQPTLPFPLLAPPPPANTHHVIAPGPLQAPAPAPLPPVTMNGTTHQAPGPSHTSQSRPALSPSAPTPQRPTPRSTATFESTRDAFPAVPTRYKRDGDDEAGPSSKRRRRM